MVRALEAMSDHVYTRDLLGGQGDSGFNADLRREVTKAGQEALAQSSHATGGTFCLEQVE